MITFKLISLLIIISAIISPRIGFALDIDEFYVSSADISLSDATMYRHRGILFGMPCISGPVGKLQNKGIIKIGDLIAVNKYELKIGIIKVSKCNEDFGYGENIICLKGENICVIAADKNALPSEDDCDALWIRARPCTPLTK